MKKAYVLIFLLFAVCLSLTACSLKSSQASNENSPQISADTANTQKTDETDKLSERLKQYKSFLQDEISSETKSDGPCSLIDFCNIVVPGETEDGIRYALFDMTGDGLPELHVLTDISYSVHTIEDGQLITWYEGDRYCRPLNNGAIRWYKEATGRHYSYEFLDSRGETILVVGMSAPPKGAKKNVYKYIFATGDGDGSYEDVELSKKKWDKLTRPFLSIGSDKIIWKNINNLDF